MTRKHFEALAEALRLTRPEIRTGPRWSQWLADRAVIAAVCARANANFQRGRFLVWTEK